MVQPVVVPSGACFVFDLLRIGHRIRHAVRARWWCCSVYQIGAYSSSSSKNSKNASATILNCESSDFSPPLRGRAFHRMAVGPCYSLHVLKFSTLRGLGRGLGTARLLSTRRMSLLQSNLLGLIFFTFCVDSSLRPLPVATAPSANTFRRLTIVLGESGNRFVQDWRSPLVAHPDRQISKSCNCKSRFKSTALGLFGRFDWLT